MKELKFYNEIHKYNNKERIRLYEEIKELIKDYNKLSDIVYKMLEKENDRDNIAKALSVLLSNADVRNLKAENCIDIDFLNGVVYTIAFNGEIEVLTSIEYLDFNGSIWLMDLEEYKELLKELKVFIGEK